VGFLGVFFWVLLGGFFIANPGKKHRILDPTLHKKRDEK
jgi:hypothetical protein